MKNNQWALNQQQYIISSQQTSGPLLGVVQTTSQPQLSQT